MKIKLWHIILVLAAVLATPALFKYAAAHRTFSGIGGEVLLILLAVAFCAVWEQGRELVKMWREGEE